MIIAIFRKRRLIKLQYVNITAAFIKMEEECLLFKRILTVKTSGRIKGGTKHE